MTLSDSGYSQAEQKLIEELRSKMNVSAGIIRKRAELGLTQSDLAIRAQTKQARVSEVESMKGNPRFSTLDSITRVLGLMVTVVPRPFAEVPSSTTGAVYFGDFGNFKVQNYAVQITAGAPTSFDVSREKFESVK